MEQYPTRINRRKNKKRLGTRGGNAGREKLANRKKTKKVWKRGEETRRGNAGRKHGEETRGGNTGRKHGRKNWLTEKKQKRFGNAGRKHGEETRGGNTGRKHG